MLTVSPLQYAHFVGRNGAKTWKRRELEIAVLATLTPEQIAIGGHVCSSCEQWKLPEEFQTRARDGRPARVATVCRECDRQRTLTLIRPRQEALARIKLDRGCARCGYNEYAVALDFEHDPPRLGKTPPLSALVTRTSIPLADLIAEAERCIVLCANCHRVVSAEQTWHRDAVRADRAAV